MAGFAHEIMAVNLEDEMRQSYLDYAMSVIVGRALPDVRDGLKPVHRRALFAMHELGNEYNKPYKKSARVVGDVIGKYHPHGDTAVYDTIVRMAQPFSLRYLLVDGQGNFGSVDGDAPAAMRYTEVRMTKLAHELLADLEKDTVDFGANYDGSEQEPLVMPTKIPNLLINGSTGIAVGMATNIPPHNLHEIISATIALIEQPELSVQDLMEFVPGPDFPTGGIINGAAGIREAYQTGRGRIHVRARTVTETSGNRQSLIVTELPYQVNKARLQETIADLVKDKRLEGISELRDESDKDGMRLVIEIKRDADADVVLNNLYQNTQMQTVFGINVVVLDNGQPKVLNLKQLLEAFIRHRREVVTRRTRYLLRKARERAHILEGLTVALANIDEVITLIKASAGAHEARAALVARGWQPGQVAVLLARTTDHATRPDGLALNFGLRDEAYHLSETQAQQILDMRLQRLTGLEYDKIVSEYEQKLGEIAEYLNILADDGRLLAVIKEELRSVEAQFADARRTEIVNQRSDLSLEDLITPQDVVVTMSHAGYIKYQPLSEYQAQKRGGKGKLAAATREADFIDKLWVTHTHDWLLCFTTLGRMYWLKVYQLPEGSRGARGKPIVNMLSLLPNEKISTVLPIKDDDFRRESKKYSETQDSPEIIENNLENIGENISENSENIGENSEIKHDEVMQKGVFVFMATRHGTVKKTPLSAFSRPRAAGIIAINLDEGDELIGVALTNGQSEVLLFSSAGQGIRFKETDVRVMGRAAGGVRGMRLNDGARVIALMIAGAGEILTVSERGYGKRTNLSDYPVRGRGGLGVIAQDISDKTGELVTALEVNQTDELMLIADSGKLIRTRVAEVRVMGRNTQGVRLIRLDDTERLVGVDRIDAAEVVDLPEGEDGEAEMAEA